MNEVQALEIGREAIMTMLTMSLPVMVVSLGIGLIIALFQALTQLQEMTLVFVPKIVVVFVALIILAPFMLNTLITFTEMIADRIISIG